MQKIPLVLPSDNADRPVQGTLSSLGTSANRLQVTKLAELA